MLRVVYLGFILSIIAFTTVTLQFVGYIILFFMKKNAILERFTQLMFLLSLVCVMVLSWSLVIMNEGYNVNLYISIDYGYVLIMALPVLITYEVLDALQRRVIKKSDKWYNNVLRYLLPMLTGIVFFVCCLVFFFNCNYFSYLLL